MFNFQSAIVAFNKMYQLPVGVQPHLDAQILGVGVISRLTAFKDILSEECKEIDEILSEMTNGEVTCTTAEHDLKILTMLADLLGDIQVYCASEMAKFGIPLNATLEIIMDSNMSKLGADGLPIYDERGKVQKGPNYWKPEPAITEMLTQHRQKIVTPMNEKARNMLDKQNATMT